MTDDLDPTKFKKAPRPRMTDAEQAEVKAAVAPAGAFGRASAGVRDADPAPPASPAPPAPPEPVAIEPPKVQARPKPKPKAKEEERKGWSIKFDVSDEVYTELLLAARKRRVTLKYLCLEMLSEKGFSVDLEKASQDGRRER